MSPFSVPACPDERIRVRSAESPTQPTEYIKRGAVHEWFGAGEQFPLAVLIGVVAATPAHGRLLWVGRRCWPYPHALIDRQGSQPDDFLIKRSTFIDPPGRTELVWAADLALRSSAVAVVIVDGTGLSMPESRRLQLSASSGNATGLIVRPERDRRAISAAHSRWLARPCAIAPGLQSWDVELLRCKGIAAPDWAKVVVGGKTLAESMRSPGFSRDVTPGESVCGQSSVQIGQRWNARRNHATGRIEQWTKIHVDLASDMGDRSPPTSQGAKRSAIA